MELSTSGEAAASEDNGESALASTPPAEGFADELVPQPQPANPLNAQTTRTVRRWARLMAGVREQALCPWRRRDDASS
jgi:hypothetical protein